jgi:hypothetical protein
MPQAALSDAVRQGGTLIAVKLHATIANRSCGALPEFSGGGCSSHAWGKTASSRWNPKPMASLIKMQRYADSLDFGVVAARDVLRDPTAFAGAMREAFAELLALRTRAGGTT